MSVFRKLYLNAVYPSLSNTVGNTGLALVKNGMSQPSDREWSCKSGFRHIVSFCSCRRLPKYISSRILGPRIFENIRKWRMTNHWIGFARTRKGKLNVDYFSCTDRLSFCRFEPLCDQINPIIKNWFWSIPWASWTSSFWLSLLDIRKCDL